MNADGWATRRAQVKEHVAQTARALVEMAWAKEKAQAPALRPPPRDYARFAARFPFTETEDQARAIEATLRDLASGKPMDRLVCGDVGFGKTEVALRAAAAAVFAGKQVVGTLNVVSANTQRLGEILPCAMCPSTFTLRPTRPYFSPSSIQIAELPLLSLPIMLTVFASI